MCPGPGHMVFLSFRTQASRKVEIKEPESQGRQVGGISGLWGFCRAGFTYFC